MSWGTAQEGATLYGIMHALPRSSLLEAGLFRVRRDSLARYRGADDRDLPPLGASPDGLLWHRDGPCTRADVLGAAEGASAAAGRVCSEKTESVVRRNELTSDRALPDACYPQNRRVSRFRSFA